METGGLLKAFSSVESSLTWRRPEDGRRTLRLVLALNQEIGRLAKRRPEVGAEARELQKRVNVLTLATKAGRNDDALLALEDAKEALSALCSRVEKTPRG